jgi:hypothetical protein
MLEWALYYARNGVPVFPLREIFWLPDGTPSCTCKKTENNPVNFGTNCKAIGKHPEFVKGVFEHGHNDATTDEAKIRAAWGMFPNAGIGRGTAGEIVLDLDGPAGMEALARFQAEDGPYPETLRARSGRLAGGEHVFYKTPNIPGAELISTKSPAPGMDIRANGRSFVVQAPSLHKSGRRYEWINPGTPIADAPPALVARLVALLSPSTGNGEPYQRPVGEGVFKAGSVLASMARLSPRTGRATLDFEAALAAIDPLSTRSMKGRESIDRALWRDLVWTMRAHERDWRDGYALERCKEWSQQFASWDEAAFFNQYWDFYRIGGPELGKQRLYDLADQLAPGWRERAWAAQGVVRSNNPQAEASRPPIGEGASAGASLPPQGPPPPVPPVLPGLPQPRQPQLADVPIHRFAPRFISFPIMGEKGPKSTDARNVLALFSAMQFIVKYDEFTHKMMIEHLDRSRREVTDGVLHQLYVIAHGLGLNVSKTLLTDALFGVGYMNVCNSAREFLESIGPWDGIERADTIYIRHLGCADTPYTRGVGILSGVAAVRRILNPGCKYDHMPVAISPEGYGKSSLWMLLVGEGRFEASVNFGADPKTLVEQTVGKMVVEIPEMANLRRKEVEHVKSLVSRQRDTARASYGRVAETTPRAFVFWGTTNRETPLVGHDGNRRFLLLHCTKPIDFAEIMAEREQLWAEWIHKEKTYGPALVLPKEAREEAFRLQTEGVEKSEIEETLAAALDEWESGFVPVHEAYRLLGVDSADLSRSPALGAQIKAAFKAAGWETARPYIAKRRTRGYVKGKNGPVLRAEHSLTTGAAFVQSEGV